MEASFKCEIKLTTGPPNLLDFIVSQWVLPTGFEQFNFLRIPARVTAMELVMASLLIYYKFYHLVYYGQGLFFIKFLRYVH
jgi:hypothetical protein